MCATQFRTSDRQSRQLRLQLGGSCDVLFDNNFFYISNNSRVKTTAHQSFNSVSVHDQQEYAEVGGFCACESIQEILALTRKCRSQLNSVILYASGVQPQPPTAHQSFSYFRDQQEYAKVGGFCACKSIQEILVLTRKRRSQLCQCHV